MIPYPGESVDIYLSRLIDLVQKYEDQVMEEHVYAPKKGPWYLHKRPQNCWACDSIAMFHQMVDIIADMCNINKAKKLKFDGNKRLSVKSGMKVKRT